MELDIFIEQWCVHAACFFDVSLYQWPISCLLVFVAGSMSDKSFRTSSVNAVFMLAGIVVKPTSVLLALQCHQCDKHTVSTSISQWKLVLD